MRPEPHSEANRHSAAIKGDRITHRPKTLKSLLRWAQHAYELEPPPRLHDRDIADDGAPDHTPEAGRWLATSKPKGNTEPWDPPTDAKLNARWETPDDWVKVACRVDADGYYVTPLRCSIERVPGVERRALLKATLPNLLFPEDAAVAAGIPSWCAEDVLYRALTILWERYADRPLPRRTNKSEAQLDAEAA